MKEADIHVLNWELFSKNKTVDNKKINKGILFEDLIEKLLIAMFPDEIWNRTGISYDGKKDFVYPADEFLPEQKWAECKNYNDNISINVISPTLIMGSIDNIEHIYFFSYSQLNDNAIDGIVQFSKSSNKKVTVFDGNLLESLICKYHNNNGINKFFPNTNFEEAQAILNTKEFRIISYLKDANGNHISNKHIFQLGESFKLNIIIQNLSLDKTEYRIEIINDKKVTFIKNRFQDSISFSEINGNSVSCQSLISGTSYFDIIITSKNNYNEQKRQKIKISDEPYLFWTGERAFKAYDICKNHLLNYNNKPLIIHSKGGAGKSTLLKALSNEEAIEGKYTIINIDLELSRSFGVKNIYCQAVNLSESNENSLEQIHEQEVLSVLLNNYARSASMIAHNIIKLYNYNKPYLFIIDDIQKINRSYIELVLELHQLSLIENKPVYFLFALNSETLSIQNIMFRLNWDEYYENNKCEFVELFYFNKSEILSFLKHRFGLIDIDNYFECFEKEISPLEIQSFSTYLINSGIITLTPMTSIYQIVDRIQFAEDVNKILYSNYSIKSLCSTFEGSDVPEYVLKYLCINNELPLNDNIKYHSAIRHLINSKIIKEVDGKIVFSHEKIKETILKNASFSEEDYVDIFYDKNSSVEGKTICAINQIDRIREAPSFLRDFFAINQELKKSEQLYDICWSIFTNIKWFKEYNLTSTALRFVKNNLKRISYEQNQDKYYNLISYIYRTIKSSFWDIDEECVECIAFFIKKYFDRTISTYNHHNVYTEYLEIATIFSNVKNLSNDRKNFWLSHYSNRAAISLDRNSNPFKNEPKEVSELYELSVFYYNNSLNNDDLLMQIYIDNFYRKYIYHHDLSLEFVQESYDKLSKIERSNIERKICLKYHLLLLKYLEFVMNNSHSSKELEELLQKVNELRKESDSSFYNLKLYLLEIYCLIDIKNYHHAYYVIDEATKFAYQKGMRISIYKLTFAKMFLLGYCDFGTANDYQAKTILTLEQFMNTKGTSKSSIKRESYIVIELLSAINTFSPEYVKNYTKCFKNKDVVPYELLKIINGESNSNLEYKNNKSYFVYEGINFPPI